MPQSGKLQESLAHVSQDNYKKDKSNSGHHSKILKTIRRYILEHINDNGICNKMDKSNESKPHAFNSTDSQKHNIEGRK